MGPWKYNYKFLIKLTVMKSSVFQYFINGAMSGLVVSELDSGSKGCGFESRLIQNTRCKWGQTHARIDSSIEKHHRAKWGTPNVTQL